MDDLDRLNARIDNLSDQIEALYTKQEELQKERDKIIADRNTKALLNSIPNINEQNSMQTFLFNDTKTTPIMDEFRKKEFLIINHFEWYNSLAYGAYDLIIVHYKPSISFVKTNLTMTKLKQNQWDFSALDKAIKSIDASSFEKNGYASFEVPILISGQTSANQTGYGDIYNGEELVVEGTKYGETTSYFAIGVLKSKEL